MQDEEQTNAKENDTRAHSCFALMAHLVKHAPHVQGMSAQ